MTIISKTTLSKSRLIETLSKTTIGKVTDENTFNNREDVESNSTDYLILQQQKEFNRDSSTIIHKHNNNDIEKPKLMSYGMLILVATGFIISVGLVNITKYLYVAYDFKFALFLTCTHMVTSYVAAILVLFVFNLLPNRKILTMTQQVKLILPFSLAGTGSLAAANLALIYLFPSLHAMLQNVTPFCTLVLSILILGSSYNWIVYISMIPICCGGVLCAQGETSNLAYIGLFFSISAAGLRAARSVLQASLLCGADLKVDSMSLLYYSSPFNFLIFLFASFLFEGFEPWIHYTSLPVSGQLWLWIGAISAALFNLIGFVIISHLGALTNVIIGGMKIPCSILTSCILFGNKISKQQIFGFSISFIGVLIYDKYGKKSTQNYDSKTVEIKPSITDCGYSKCSRNPTEVVVEKTETDHTDAIIELTEESSKNWKGNYIY